MNPLTEWWRRQPRKSLEGLPHDVAQRLLWKAMWRSAVHPRSLLLLGIACLPPLLFLQGVGFALDQGRLSDRQAAFLVNYFPQWMFAAWGLVVVWMFPWMCGVMMLHSRVLRRKLKQLMLEQGLRPSSCLDCGYDLRATEGDTCPECGGQIAPPRRNRTSGESTIDERGE
ncbi:MAG: hypothetical protein WD534_03235 [Phycisphaeraceae bacterium]